MLEERQILRYARQILLREVGGRGQERLLERLVQVRGASPALEVAVTYLAAGGSPLNLGAAALTPAFLGGATLQSFNEDAQPSAGPAFAELVAAPERPSGRLPCVLVGEGGLVCWPTAPDLGAIERALGQLAAPGPAAPPVLLGSLAAVALQRVLLGLAPGPDAIVWTGAGLSATAVL